MIRRLATTVAVIAGASAAVAFGAPGSALAAAPPAKDPNVTAVCHGTAGKVWRHRQNAAQDFYRRWHKATGAPGYMRLAYFHHVLVVRYDAICAENDRRPQL